MARVYKKLTYVDRKTIEEMLASGYKPKKIADEVGVCNQTIYRELVRGRDASGKYNAETAQMKLFS